MSKQVIYYLQLIGSIFVLIGAALKYFSFEIEAYKYIFSAGALSLLVVSFAQYFNNRKGNTRVQRQYRLMLFATAFLGVSAYLMFRNDERWVILVLVYALVSVFLSFRSDKTE